MRLSTPGAVGIGTNPEQLLAAGWSACFESAIAVAARKHKVPLPPELAIDAEVDLSIASGAYFLRARLNVNIPGLAPETARVVSHALLKHHVFSKPIVAAVNGDCVGGGVELLLSTDIRVATPEARFGLPEVKWSIYPFGGATVKLVQQIGYVHAMDLLLTGRLIDATEAARLSLINRIVPADGLMAWALETAETIAANSPAAVQAVKRQISSTIADHALTREALEQELGDRVRASAYFQEGVAAFREKRKPEY